MMINGLEEEQCLDHLITVLFNELGWAWIWDLSRLYISDEKIP